MENTKLIPNANWQTQQRGTNDQEYQIYLSCANDGKGGDITRNGASTLNLSRMVGSMINHPRTPRPG